MILRWTGTTFTSWRAKGRFICSEKPLIAYRVHAAATTKACIEDNRRPADEMAMFRKMW